MTEGRVVSEMSAPPGLALADRYVVGDLLGRGGMADVYRATDRVLERQVAVKILRQPGLAADERERFLAEARTLAALSHPALVTLLDVYSGDDCTFLVMELIEGSSLSEISRSQRPSRSRVTEIGRQLAEVLTYVHNQGVVHRDIKPANVLIDGDGRVRLADFGIARVLGDVTRHTATGFTVGTAAYVAPEQLLGTEISEAADIYALGLVLLECLNGTPTFKGTPAEILVARVAASPTIPNSLPAEWRSLLSDMTRNDPSERPSASAVRDRFAAISATADACLASDTQSLSLTHTRPLTTPIPEAATPKAMSAIVSEDADHSHRERGEATASRYLRTLAHLSTRMQLMLIAVLTLIVVACIGIVVSSAGDGSAPRDRAPDVPGKIGQDLQSLHDAVYP